MEKKIFLVLLLLLIISFISNFYIQQKLCENLSKIKTENIENLDHHSNKNFNKNRIENIGENLQEELVKLNGNHSEIKIRNDVFNSSGIKLCT